MMMDGYAYILKNIRPAQKVTTHHAGFMFEMPIRMNISSMPFDRKVPFGRSCLCAV